MKKFDFITEIDARSLARGETVILSRGGHVTPLARDTLREKRIILIDDGQASEGDALLAPKAEIRSVVIGSDHTGVALRGTLAAFLRGRGLAVQDLGTYGKDPV